MEEMQKIGGEVDAVIYRSEETGFCVLALNYDDELINVVGDFGDVEEGEELILTGRFVNHPKFGEQFKTELFERSLPTTSAAIQKYLSSGAIKGIGHILAKKLVKHFGEETLDIIENSPERLTEIAGITSKKAKKMQEDFKSSFAVRSLMTYMNSQDIPTSYGIKAFKRWGENAEQMIKANPYLLCGFGISLPFEKADNIAEKNNMPKNWSNRIKAGISYVLERNADNGHTCLPLEQLKKLTSNFLDVDADKVQQIIDEQVDDEVLFYYFKKKRPFVMLRKFYQAEDYIARRMDIMREISFDNQIDFSAVIDLEEENSGIHYEEIQRKAINLALSKGFLVLTGGPGTGKTTTLNAIISLYKQQELNVMIAAPTGRAAKRLSDLTGCEAKTIHRLLEVDFSGGNELKFVHNENNLLECDALIIDEMSMVDSCLFESLLRAISITCKLILVGDSDQLPSVGAGNVLKDIIESNTVSVVTLKEIFRQSKKSDIIMNAHKIVNGEHIDLKVNDKDFFFFQRLEYPALQQLVVDLCKKRLPKAFGYSPLEDIQVLSPTRKGPAGTNELNKILQDKLNPPKPGKSQIKTLNYIFRKGDKVMQTKNDYEILWKKQTDDEEEKSGKGIFNGDIGIIIDVNKILKTVTIDFEGRIANYTLEMLDNLEPAYAVTVHKSQGSEYNVVILTVFGGYDKLYYRNLLYTAVTRAKKMLIIVGSKKRVDFMIDNNLKTRRYTALKNMLRDISDTDNEKEPTLFKDIK